MNLPWTFLIKRHNIPCRNKCFILYNVTSTKYCPYLLPVDIKKLLDRNASVCPDANLWTLKQSISYLNINQNLRRDEIKDSWWDLFKCISIVLVSYLLLFFFLWFEDARIELKSTGFRNVRLPLGHKNRQILVFMEIHERNEDESSL